MSSCLKKHFTSMVKEIIPLGVPRCNSLDATSSSCLEPSEKSSLPKCIPPTKNPELEQRDKSSSAPLKASNKRTEQDSILKNTEYYQSCRVVVKKLQPKHGNVNLNKNISVNPTVKKDNLRRNSSYNRDREKEISFALCKELNENLRVRGGLFQSAVKDQRRTLPQSTHSRHNPESRNSCSFQQRPSVKILEGFLHHPDQKKDRLDKRDHKTSRSSNMSLQKEFSASHEKTRPEGRLSIPVKRKREEDSDKEIKRRCVDLKPTPSSSITNSPLKFIKRAFVKSSNEFVITINEKQSPTEFPSTSNTNNKSRPSSSLPRELFKPCKDSNTGSDKPPSVQLIKSPSTAEPKDAMVARANKNPKTPPSQPHLRKVSPKSSTTFDNIETHFAPDYCLSFPKTHHKKPCGEREICTVSTNTSSSSSHKEGFKVCSPPHQTDLRSPSFAEQASSCKMEPDERTQLKVEQSRSPKAIMPGPAVSVKEEGSRQQKCCPQWKDPLDSELGDDSGDELRDLCAISLSSSRSSNEDEQLPSLKEIMDWSARVPVTPKKDAFSEPNTPVQKAAPEAVKTKAISYRNTLEQMLQEKEQYQRSKELETQLLESCEEDLLNLEENENSGIKEEDISLEQREFLQKFSVASCAIRDIHPGEEVFIPAKFGRLFNHQTLDLRKISVTPHNRSQQFLLQAPAECVLSMISAGLLSKAYFSSPCQPEVTRWLFQMMSVHPNPCISSMLVESLRTLALSAAQQIVEHQSQSFRVWVPSIRDITLVFLNMGASFISLFPLEALQPPFTEGDLLEAFQPEETSQDRVISDSAFLPTDNLENVLKYLSVCTALCLRAYTDEELMLLLAVVCRIGLETHFQLLPTVNFSILLHSLLKNFTNWHVQISKACQILTDLSEDHHNLRRLVSLLPDNTRGKQLKRHLSVSIISKLLNHTCTYKISGTEFKLSELKPYLPQMRPSSLLKVLRSSRTTEDCDATLDQQAYYLCYSLLTLTNEASNFEFLPSNQRNDLRSLSSLLEKHIKCDIRECAKMLYRSKVKDFVARIYTKWQVLLTRTRPQEGKLYDYWMPSSPQGQSCIKAQDSSEIPEETLTAEWSSAESDEDAEENCVEDVSDVEEKSDEPKQHDDTKLEEISDLENEDDDENALMNRGEELLKDEEPHEEDRKPVLVEDNTDALEELEDLLQKDMDLLELKEEMEEGI